MEISDVKKLNKGDLFSGHFLITSVTKKVAKNGNDFLDIILSDKTGILPLKIWNISESEAEKYSIDTVVAVQTNFDDYQGKAQVSISETKPEQQISPIPVDDPLSRKELYVQTAPMTEQQMRDKVLDYVLQIENEAWNRIVREFLAEYGDKYFTHPAAQSVHEAFVGGLAYHSLLVTKLALSIADSFPDAEINRSLLIAGALLHDAGKIIELDTEGSTTYTVAGQLIGHITFSDELIVKLANKLDYDPNSEDIILLRHLIISHHGKREWGTPVEPRTLEAFILHESDLIDARVQPIQEALEQVNPGEFTPKIYFADNRSFYKPKD